MTTQTPTQIASEIMDNTRAFEENECELCDINKILAHKQDWENELEFLKLTIDFTGLDKCMKDWFNSRISELTSALKILNTKEAFK